MHPELIHIGGITIYAYGFMIMIVEQILGVNVGIHTLLLEVMSPMDTYIFYQMTVLG